MKTITLRGINPETGKQCVYTDTITVRDPDVEYAGNRSICVDPSGSFAGAPFGSQQFTTIAQARAAMNALGTTTHRLMLARGQVFNENLNIDDDIRNLRIVPFGSGPNPIWTKPTALSQNVAITFGSGNLCDDFMVYGIDFVGGYDPSVQGGYPDFEPWSMGTHNAALNPSMGVYKCNFTGCLMVQAGATEPNFVFAMCDSHVTDWLSYGVFQQSSSVSAQGLSRNYFRGVSFHQKPRWLPQRLRQGQPSVAGAWRLSWR